MTVAEALQVENPNVAIDVAWQSRKDVVSEEHDVLAVEEGRDCTQVPLATSSVNFGSTVDIPTDYRVTPVTEFKSYGACQDICPISIAPPF